MNIKSSFRKLFWIRLAIGIILFAIVFTFALNIIFNDFNKSKIALLAGAFAFLLFLIYASLDFFKIFSLVVTQNGIEKTLIITKRKQIIPFEMISNIKQERVKYRNIRAVNVSDGHHVSILKLDNGKSLIISPDHFENYDEIVLAIKKHVV